MRKSAHKGIIADFCENSTTACNIEDESGNPVEPDEMCMDINVCDQGMTLFEIVPLALEFFKIFQVLLKDISPDEAAKLLASKKSRVNEFKKKQAQLKLIEMEAIKKKYNDVLEAEKTKFIELYPNTKSLILATETSEDNGEGQTNNSEKGEDEAGGDVVNENQPNPNQTQNQIKLNLGLKMQMKPLKVPSHAEAKGTEGTGQQLNKVMSQNQRCHKPRKCKCHESRW